MDMLNYWQRYCAPYIKALLVKDDEKGASLVEYALLVALIAVVCIAAVSTLGGNARDKFSTIGASIGK